MPVLETVRAKAGATFLDIVQPGWADEINLDTLDLADCEACVLGQLCGSYGAGVEKFFGMVESGGYAASDRAGFDVAPGVRYGRLTAAWKREIAKRQEG